MGNEQSMPGSSFSAPPASSASVRDNSFGATFAREHLAQGSNGKFEWNGKEYSTSRADGRDLRAERMTSQSIKPSSSSFQSSNIGMSNNSFGIGSTFGTTFGRENIFHGNEYSTSTSRQSTRLHTSGPVNTLTFNAEGNNNRSSPYYSRIVHHATLNSGITIGRGYDMKEKSSNKIKNELIKCGISANDATILSSASGLYGNKANLWKEKNKNFIKKFELTQKQENNLFNVSYNELENDMKRICNKPDIVNKYGKTDWNNLNKGIKEIIIDLRFRGDSTPKTRQSYHKYVVNNDVKGLLNVMKDKKLWNNVPNDRFNRRIQRLQKEIN